MKNRYLLLGAVFGALVAILIGGRDLVLCAATAVLSVPFGAAVGYFLDYGLAGFAPTGKSDRGRIANETTHPHSSTVNPHDTGFGCQRVDGLGLHLEDLDTRRSLTDIRIV